MDKTLKLALEQHVLWLKDTANLLQLNVSLLGRDTAGTQRAWLLRLTAMVATLNDEAARVERWIAEAAKRAV